MVRAGTSTSTTNGMALQDQARPTNRTTNGTEQDTSKDTKEGSSDEDGDEEGRGKKRSPSPSSSTPTLGCPASQNGSAPTAHRSTPVPISVAVPAPASTYGPAPLRGTADYKYLYPGAAGCRCCWCCRCAGATAGCALLPCSQVLSQLILIDRLFGSIIELEEMLAEGLDLVARTHGVADRRYAHTHTHARAYATVRTYADTCLRCAAHAHALTCRTYVHARSCAHAQTHAHQIVYQTYTYPYCFKKKKSAAGFFCNIGVLMVL
jgi:hypothetical protein